MPKKYLAGLLLAFVGVVVAAGAAVVVRRARTEHPPVSPTVPRVDELDVTTLPEPGVNG